MSELGLLNGLQDVLVQTEGDGDGQNGQRCVREDRDERNRRQRDENGQKGSENNARFSLIAPVNQIDDCKDIHN